jgi:hypothetical protein
VTLCCRFFATLALGAAAGCHASAGGLRPELGLAASLLPNLGLAAALSAPIHEAGAWQLEARFTDQFLDDKSFADNGLPEAGNWTQLDLGLLRLSPWEDERAWSFRFGLTGFEARGEPNLADEAGEYFGAYCGVGRFRRFGRSFAIGPELTLVVATGPDPRVVIPQLTWGLRWMPGAP